MNNMMEPKIRFKGFEGEWETQSLSDHNFSIIAGGDVDKKLLQNNGKYPVIANALTNDGILGYYMDSFRVNGPAVTVTGRGDIGVAIARHYSFTPVVRLLSIKSNHNVDFLANAINCYKAAKESTGVPQLTTAKLQEYRIPIPKEMDEENAIASYFTSLDSQISASTSRLASLKQMKAASLQAMFPQEGETVPKIRFKGFEGEWKKVMFSETFEFLKNNSLSRAELSNEGDIVNVHYGDVLIKYGDLLNIQNEELTFIADNKIGNTLYNSCHLQNGDIIIADAAEDNTVGKCSEIVNICNKRVVSGLHTIPCRPLNRFAQGYLGHYINSESYHNQLLPLIQGSKISSISKKTLSQTIVLVPSIEEQKCIGNYFTSLDRQISLQSQRLEKLKQIKSACLDKMFV